MSTYILCEKFIKAKTYSEQEISKRVNMFYMFDQLTQEEYEDLMQLIEDYYTE